MARSTVKVAGKRKPAKKAVIASRKSCGAKGTGLSHYILMDEKAR
ncbi:MAG TPA: modified peptide precursor CbpA [Anaeromyxobacteraceae bacterium]|nr:modified peptide precursor CbpA [Anaeromyxobacteraceae bacterium]